MGPQSWQPASNSTGYSRMLALGLAVNENGIINKPHGFQNPSLETVLFLISHLNFTITREDVETVCPLFYVWGQRKDLRMGALWSKPPTMSSKTREVEWCVQTHRSTECQSHGLDQGLEPFLKNTFSKSLLVFRCHTEWVPLWNFTHVSMK